VIDLCSQSFNDVITPYIGGIEGDGELQDSYTRTSLLSNGNLVKLFLQGFGKVEEGFVVDAQPQGK